MRNSPHSYLFVVTVRNSPQCYLLAFTVRNSPHCYLLAFTVRNSPHCYLLAFTMRAESRKTNLRKRIGRMGEDERVGWGERQRERA